MKKYIFLIIVVLFLTFSFLYIFFNINDNFYDTKTRAVCNGNKCQDYEFTCLKGSVVNSRAIGGFVIFGDDWVDRREKKEKC